MVTKRTRALSIFAAVAMLVSMFACFVIPASATTDEVAAIKTMYQDVLANSSADTDGALAAALAATYEDAASATTALSAAAAGVTLNEDVKPRYAYNEAYTAAGYATKAWYISTPADLYALMKAPNSNVTANNVGTFGGVTFYFTADIDMKDYTDQEPIAQSCMFAGTIDGQNHAIYNLNITKESTQVICSRDQGVGLTACLYGGKIMNLGIASGKIVNTKAGSSGYVGAFSGQAVGGASLTNCWNGADVVSAYTNGNAQYAGAMCGNGITMTNCFNIGTFTSLNNSSAVSFFPYGTTYVVTNSIDAGTVIGSGYVATMLSHPNGFKVGNTNLNTYSVGHDLWKLTAAQYSDDNPTDSWETDKASYTIDLPDGTTNATVDQYNKYYRAASVGEAAYKTNAGANGAVYYTLKDGVLAFGTEANQVRKITATRGAMTQVFYFADGSTVSLADIYADKAESVTVGGNTVEGSFTVSGNMEISVIDTAESAKEALYAKLQEAWDKEDLNMYTQIQDWPGQAEELIKNGTDKDAILAKGAEIDTLLAGELTLDTEAYMPYSKKAAYTNLGCTDTANYSINSKEDWLALVNESNLNNNTSNSFAQTYHVLNDVDFENIEMQPFCYYFQTNATIKGYGHAFKNINVKGIYTGDTSTGANRGFGLISKINNGVEDLHIESGSLTVEVQNAVSDSKCAYVGGITGNGTLTNCSSAATLNVTCASTIPADVKIYVGGLAGNSGASGTASVHSGVVNVDLTGATATVDQSYIIGGVIGYAQGDPSNLINEGTVNVKTASTAAQAQYTYTGGVVGYARMPVTNSVNKGDVIVESTNARAGGIAGFVHSGKGLYKCYNEGNVTVKGSGDHVGGIVGSGTGSVTVDSCYNIGNVAATSGNAMSIYGYGGNAAKIYNSIAAGTFKTAGYRFHANIYGAVSLRPLFNSYAVGMTLLSYNGAPADNYVDGLTIDIGGDTGKAYTDETFVDYYQADSVGEAAWSANKNPDTTLGNAQVYYTIANGKLAFGTADNQVRRIAIARGSSSTYAYAVAGEEVDLFAINPGLAKAEGLEADNDIGVIDGGKFIMVNNDVIVTVNDSLESAKAALEEKIDEAWDAEDLNMYTQTQEWLATAKTLLASGEDAATIVDHMIAADGILAGTLTLDTTAYAPYSKKANFPDNPTTDYSINRAEDWLALVSANGFNGINIHVNRDIDFENVEMLPLGINQNTGIAGTLGETGILDGHGYTFKHINVVSGHGTNWRVGVALVGGLNGGTIQNLGLTGTVTNTETEATWMDGSTARTNLTAAFVGGKQNGDGGAIKNCWSDVDVTGPSNATGARGLAAFNAYGDTTFIIENCINYGTITSTTNGVAAAFMDDKISNCINAGEFVTTGIAAGFVTAHIANVTNSYSVGTKYAYDTSNSSYIDTNEVSAKEAAYKATNGTTYYTVKDGVPAFGTATDRVFAVKLTGDYEAVGYYLPGEVCNVYEDLGLTKYDDTTFSGATVDADGNVTMGTADITITVAYGDSQVGTAKDELKKLIDHYEQYDPDLLSEESTVDSWLNDANEIYAAEDATYAAVKAQIVAADLIVASMKDGYYVPYSTKDTVYDIVNAADNYGIYTEADWEALANAGTDVTVDTLHIMNDIVFTKSIKPIAYGGIFSGNIDGHNHVLTIQMNFSDSDLTSGVGLISRMQGDHYIKNLGLAGTLEYSLSGSAGSKYVGGFVGQVEQRIQFIKCFTTLDITINKAQYGGTFVGGPPTLNTRYDGCFAAGSFSATYTDNGGFTGGYTGNAHLLYNSFDASVTDASYMLRIHSNAIGEDGWDSTRTGNIYTVNKDIFYFNDMSSTVPSSNAEAYAAKVEQYKLAEDAYTTGEVGYLLNQGYVENTGTRVYYSYDAENKAVVFGKDDGSDQVRMVTFIQGDVETVTYASQGSTLDVTQFGGISNLITYTEETDGDINAATYTVPDRDIKITVTSNVPDGYADAFSGLTEISEKYDGYLKTKKADTVLSNYAEIQTAKTNIDNTLAAVENATDTAPYEAVVTLYASHTELSPEVSGKVPYEAKADYPAATEYGIYDVADWNKAVAEATNANLYLMNDIDFESNETATFTSYSGIFDGQGNALNNIKITTVTSNNAALFRTLTGTVKNVEITGAVDVEVGSADAPASAVIAVAVVAANANEGTVSGVTNYATITADVYSTGRVYIGTMNGQLATITGCKNYGAVTVTGFGSYLGAGGLNGRTNQTVSDSENHGTVTVTDKNAVDAGRYTYVGGICGATAGDVLTNVKNTGAITVTGGTHVVVGGIQSYGTDTDEDKTISGAINEGDINVTAMEGASLVIVGGIMGQAMWPVVASDMGISNAGDITVEAYNAYTNVYVGGIAGTISALATEGFTASNTGAIKVGGMDADNEAHAAAQLVASTTLTVTGTEGGSLDICDHANMEYAPVEDSMTHTANCSDCSYIATKDCTIGWTHSEAEGKYYHEGACELCERIVEKTECTGSLNTHDENCMLDDEYVFDCDCGRETITIDNGAAAHVWGDWTTEGATEGYERHTCTTSGCEQYEEQTYVSAEMEGDVNRDNTIDLIDAIIVLREVAGMNEEGVCDRTFADMPDAITGVKDGVIDANDAVRIVRKWLKNV